MESVWYVSLEGPFTFHRPRALDETLESRHPLIWRYNVHVPQCRKKEMMRTLKETLSLGRPTFRGRGFARAA